MRPTKDEKRKKKIRDRVKKHWEKIADCRRSAMLMCIETNDSALFDHITTLSLENFKILQKHNMQHTSVDYRKELAEFRSHKTGIRLEYYYEKYGVSEENNLLQILDKDNSKC